MSFKQHVIQNLYSAIGAFEGYKKNNNSTNCTQVTNNFGILTCKLSISENRRGYIICEQEAKSMLYVLRTYSHPKLLSNVDAGLVYSLSQCYDIMLLQKDHQLQLLIDQNANNIESHNCVQYTPVPFIADFHIKYDSQKLDTDLRKGCLPKVDVVKYYCPETAEYVNLPNKSSSCVKISNSGSELLSLNIKH